MALTSDADTKTSFLPLSGTQESAGCTRARWYHVLPIAMLQKWAITSVLPALPRLKLEYFHGDRVLTTQLQSASEMVRAVLLTLMGGFLGNMSDRFGRQPIILLSVLCSTLPLVVLLSGNFTVYFVSFGMNGPPRWR